VLIRVYPWLFFVLFITAFAYADQVKVDGKRVTVFAPAGDEGTAKKIAAEGDRALERYAADLGVEVPPKQRFSIFLYETEEEYDAVEAKLTGGRFKRNMAFTYAKNAEVHMFMQPRPHRRVTDDGPGMLEAIAMHELSHALQYVTVPNYAAQPDWLGEGLAYVYSERADSGADGGALETLPYYAQFWFDVDDALEDGAFVPLDRLVSPSFGDTSRYSDQQIWYGEAFELVRYMDAPDGGPRRDKFRAFLKEVEGFAPGDDYAQRVSARFRDVFGVRTKSDQLASLAPLEREWVAAMKQKHPFRWHAIARDLRARADGSLVLESLPEASAYAVSSADVLGARGQMTATITIEDGPGKQADLIFAYHARDDFYKVALGSTGFATLLRRCEEPRLVDGEVRMVADWKKLSNQKCPADKLKPGVPHAVELIVDLGRIAVKVDGLVVLRFTLKDAIFGAGRYGIGAYDSRVVFRDVVATTF
jgi:hypothetical protein